MKTWSLCAGLFFQTMIVRQYQTDSIYSYMQLSAQGVSQSQSRRVICSLGSHPLKLGDNTGTTETKPQSPDSQKQKHHANLTSSISNKKSPYDNWHPLKCKSQYYPQGVDANNLSNIHSMSMFQTCACRTTTSFDKKSNLWLNA